MKVAFSLKLIQPWADCVVSYVIKWISFGRQKQLFWGTCRFGDHFSLQHQLWIKCFMLLFPSPSLWGIQPTRAFHSSLFKVPIFERLGPGLGFFGVRTSAGTSFAHALTWLWMRLYLKFQHDATKTLKKQGGCPRKAGLLVFFQSSRLFRLEAQEAWSDQIQVTSGDQFFLWHARIGSFKAGWKMREPFKACGGFLLLLPGRWRRGTMSSFSFLDSSWDAFSDLPHIVGLWWQNLVKCHFELFCLTKAPCYRSFGWNGVAIFNPWVEVLPSRPVRIWSAWAPARRGNHENHRSTTRKLKKPLKVTSNPSFCPQRLNPKAAGAI